MEWNCSCKRKLHIRITEQRGLVPASLEVEMRLRKIASIAQEEGITYRNAMRILKRNRVKIYGAGEKKAVDADIAEEIFCKRESGREKWEYTYERERKE